jgi:hypothetical protein
VTFIEQEFERQLNQGSNDVFSLGPRINNLEKLKQDTMVHYWLSEITLLDDPEISEG